MTAAAPTTQYGSAHDLPSVLELRQQVKGLKLVGVFSREVRETAKGIERQLAELCDLVDRFYALLGARHWIFDGRLSTDAVRDVLASTDDPGEAEAELIEIITERVRGDLWFLGLRGHEALRARARLLERAREHYLAEQWDSCALMLVTVIDGFLGDCDRSDNRGLNARPEDEMRAWDTLGGHHQGLNAIWSTFTKGCHRRVDDEVFELHRHGIVHGTLTNYNNVVVAAKAWNMLHALVDWEEAKRKAGKPKPVPPGWRDVWSGIKERVSQESYRKDFVATSVSVGDPQFHDQTAVQTAQRFLSAWESRQWGLMVPTMPTTLFGRNDPDGKRARITKDAYEPTVLSAYKIDAVDYEGPSVAVVRGTIKMNDSELPLALRLIRFREDGKLGGADDESAWLLAMYPPHTFVADWDKD